MRTRALHMHLIVDFGFQISFEAVPQFAYRARNAQGGLVEGVLNCADRAVAIRQIEMQQCIPIKIEAVAIGPEATAKDERSIRLRPAIRGTTAQQARFRDATARPATA